MSYWAHQLLNLFPELEFFHFPLKTGEQAAVYLTQKYPQYFKGKILDVGAGLGSLKKYVPDYTGVEKEYINSKQFDNNVSIKPFEARDAEGFDTLTFFETLHQEEIAIEALKLIGSGKKIIIFDNKKWFSNVSDKILNQLQPIVYEDMSQEIDHLSGYFYMKYFKGKYKKIKPIIDMMRGVKISLTSQILRREGINPPIENEPFFFGVYSSAKIMI